MEVRGHFPFGLLILWKTVLDTSGLEAWAGPRDDLVSKSRESVHPSILLMGLGQHGLSDGLIFLDRTSLPPPRMMEVLRCGVTLEQRLLASPAVLDRIDLVE